jgi:hypothetical protein
MFSGKKEKESEESFETCRACRIDVRLRGVPGASQSSALVIDHFDDGDFLITVSSVTTSASSTDTGSMIGGERETTLTWVSGTETSTGQVEQDAPATPSTLVWDEGDSIKGTLKLLYDGVGTAGVGSNTDGLGNVNLKVGGASQFVFNYGTVGDGSTFEVTITVKSGIGEASVKTSTGNGQFGGSGLAAIDYTSLAGDADLTKVDSIEYLFNSNLGGTPKGQGGGDYSFDLLEGGVIPEPVTMLGLFLGLGGVGAYIRKRRLA